MSIMKDAVIGVVTGDALGCPIQFETREEAALHPVTGMRGHGTYDLPAGAWTDDSSLTLALLESIRRVGGIDLPDIMANFVKWLESGEFTPFGFSFDVGGGTMKAIRRYERDGDPSSCGGRTEMDNGNGSLMRIMPAVAYCLERGLSDAEAIGVVHSVASLTHAHLRANIACGLYYFAASAVRSGAGGLSDRIGSGLEKGFAFYGGEPKYREELERYARLRGLAAFAALPERAIRSSGYVVDTLEAALWALANTDSFEAALLKAVNLGYDTDTVGAVTGGLAGLYYGYGAIPRDWLAALQRREWIEGLCDGE